MNPPAPPETSSLAGCGVVITRPAEECDAFGLALSARGGTPLPCPLITIEPLAPDMLRPEHLAAAIHWSPPLPATASTASPHADWLVFVSPAAARHGWPLACQAGLGQARLLTVGPGTAAVLNQLGAPSVLHPEQRFDSEGLLALLPQDMSGQTVLIFRGNGGRELLAETLRQRGARVGLLQCYRRSPPASIAPLLDAMQQQQAHIILFTSGEAVANLMRLLGKNLLEPVQSTTAWVTHDRVAAQVRRAGWTEVQHSAPGTDAILTAMAAWWQSRAR